MQDQNHLLQMKSIVNKKNQPTMTSNITREGIKKLLFEKFSNTCFAYFHIIKIKKAIELANINPPYPIFQE